MQARISEKMQAHCVWSLQSSETNGSLTFQILFLQHRPTTSFYFDGNVNSKNSILTLSSCRSRGPLV